MKKMIIALLALFIISSSLHAQDMPLISATNFKTITIGENMEVVLINAPGKQDDFKLNPLISEKLDISIENGRLTISNRFLHQKGIVYLMVDGLEKLVVGQNSHIITHGILQNTRLALYVSQGASAHIKSIGSINAFPTDESEISVNKVVNKPVMQASF